MNEDDDWTEEDGQRLRDRIHHKILSSLGGEARLRESSERLVDEMLEDIIPVLAKRSGRKYLSKKLREIADYLDRELKKVERLSATIEKGDRQ